MKKRFSIIICAYNIEEYISRAIDSVLNQSYKNFELIVVNDGSTDNTEKEIKKHKNVIYIKHKINKGLGGARNTGIEKSTGEYIIFLDGDDYLHDDDVLEKIDKLIGNQIPDIIYMGFEIVGTKQAIIIPKYDCKKFSRLDNDPYTWSKCWNREFVNKNEFRFPEKKYYEDVLFLCKAIIKSNEYLVTDFITHTYVRGRKNSITTNVTFKNIHDNLDNLEELIELLENETLEENREFIKSRIRRETKRCRERITEIGVLAKVSNDKNKEK